MYNSFIVVADFIYIDSRKQKNTQTLMCVKTWTYL